MVRSPFEDSTVSTTAETCPCCGLDSPYDNATVVVCGNCGYDDRTDEMYDCVDCEVSGMASGPGEWHARTHGHQVRGLEVAGHVE